jgi:hypothetical protein
VWLTESTDNRYERASVVFESGKERKGPEGIACSPRGDLFTECVFSRDADIRFPWGEG